MRDEDHLALMLARHEIRQLKEINKMLQTNMFHYEYRARDEGMKNIELECKIDELEKLIAELREKK